MDGININDISTDKLINHNHKFRRELEEMPPGTYQYCIVSIMINEIDIVIKSREINIEDLK